MKTWRVVSGILSMVLALVVILQSCAVGVAEALGAEGNDSSSGVVVALLLIAGGVVSVVTRKGGKGGGIAVLVIFAIAAAIGFGAKYYADLIIWAVWCAACAVIAIIALIKENKKSDDESSGDLLI